MISIVQSGTVFGIMLGFTLSTIIGKTHWAICFLIEAGLLTILCIIFFLLPQIYFSNNYIVIDGSDNELKQMNGGHDNNNQNVFAKLWINIGVIFKEYVFLFTCLSNCVIFFGITVITYWSPNYIENVLHEKRDYIILGVFTAIAVTAPPTGYVVGAFQGTKIGGYVSKYAIIICVICSGISVVFAMVVVASTNLAYYFVMSWMYLFATGVMVPLKTGIMISSLPERIRCDGFTITNFFLNVIGNLPASVVYGSIYEHTKKKVPWFALFITMSTNLLGFAFIIIAAVFRFKKENTVHIIEEKHNNDNSIKQD